MISYRRILLLLKTQQKITTNSQRTNYLRASAIRLIHKTTTMVFQTKHLKIGGAVILITAALIIGLSVGLSQKNEEAKSEVHRAARQSSIKPTSRRPTRPTRKPTNRTPTRRPTTKIPTTTQTYTVMEIVKHDKTSFT